MEVRIPIGPFLAKFPPVVVGRGGVGGGGGGGGEGEQDEGYLTIIPRA